MSDRILVPLRDSRKENYTLHEVLLFSKGTADKAWTIKGAEKTFTEFLEKLKRGLYYRYLESEFREIEFKLDPHIGLAETAESALLGICVKAEMEIKKQRIKIPWASVTLTGKVDPKNDQGLLSEEAENEPVFPLIAADDIAEKYTALAEEVKGKDEKHLFIYVSNDKISLRGKNKVLSNNIHIKRFPSNCPLREVFDYLFAPMVSSEGGLYFENHTIYDRFNQVYNDICKYNKDKKDEIQYYNDPDKISFTKKDYWNLIPDYFQKKR
jgi:hypothetical protein